MIKILSTEDTTLKKIFDNRQAQSEDLWTIVRNSYKENIKAWKGKPDWLAQVPRGRSKTRDNRIFMATETQLNKVTARPLKPMVTPANETEEAKEIADNLQVVFLDAYRTRNVKKQIKRGLRFLHLSRLFCLKVFWNDDIDNFDVQVADSRKVRFAKNSTNEAESEFAIEEVDDKTILELIDLFPDKETEILKEAGLSKDQALTQNPKVCYHEMWIGDGVFWKYKNLVLEKKQNPYYDFDGLLMTPEETAQVNETAETAEGVRVPRLNGRRRRQMMQGIKAEQGKRKEEVKGDEMAGQKYEAYLYNHFDRPRKPYIFGTILEVETQPIGETTLIEVVNPLQEGVDKRKRQIADNADFVNGITKVDTDLATMDLADARALHYDPEGLVFGPGVSEGVKRETGTPLPDMVFKDMQDSRNEIDAIFGTNSTFRGEGERQESATGRAILREEGLSRLDEIVDLIDFVGTELYNWWYQMIRVRYTENHLIKPLGAKRAGESIELMQDDLQEGIEIKILPGQTLPDDKLFRAEKAKEDVKDGLIDPLTYLELAGAYENPERVLKRAIMFKSNPFSVVPLDGEDLQKIQTANEFLQAITPQQGGGEETVEGDPAQVAELRERMMEIMASPEFKKAPPEKQQEMIAQMKQQLQQLGGGKVEV